ncbi:MAG TPA: hypothetical protein VMX36_09120 [Sedimentisphaerales bacterium]|nr:hypothetical protein [Sedimentisphaerales bacterium]
MLRSFSLSVGVILLLSSGVFAAIGQAEGFSISALNMVQRVGGAGWAESGNMVMVGQGQRAYTAGTAAIQKETGILIQGARVAGHGGATKILQNASVDGLQSQIVVLGKHGFQAQGQILTVGLDNVIRKTGGIGGAEGAQGFVGGQHQMLVTPGGTGVNSQVVGAAQYASVSGGPCSNVVVKNSLDVKMGQSQIVTGYHAPPKPKPLCYP